MGLMVVQEYWKDFKYWSLQSYGHVNFSHLCLAGAKSIDDLAHLNKLS